MKRRKQAASERARSTIAWFVEAFDIWLSGVGEEAAKGIFWKMAAGRVEQSPFEESVGEARSDLDRHLGRWGLDPLRKKSDRQTEVNFRRLAALMMRTRTSCARWPRKESGWEST